MGIIHVLDESTINKIAAGEVIERPSSIVKELVENSLDAGATSIQVEICDGGKTYISVKDNGCGILNLDTVRVFERHATSKINNAEDLFRIKSLGFRGEAMASIAAVSEVELTTKSGDEEDGTIIDIRGGYIKQNIRAGHPTGTSVIVRNLFFNTPARKKFLKSDLSEQASITDVVQRQALANPGVSLRLIRDGKTILHTPGNGDLLSVIQCIYGKNIVKSLIEVDHPSESMKITGYTSKTELTKGNSTFILCDFNGRPVKSRSVIEAVRQSYRNLIMNNKYPFAILRIETNPELIDVNVHPQKHEIRVTDEKALFNTVYIAIKSAISRSVMILGASEEALGLVSSNISIQKSENMDEDYSTKSFMDDSNSMKSLLVEEPIRVQATEPQAVSLESQSSQLKNKNYRIIGQHLHTYILIQIGEDLFIVDQHAAHERINYEYLRDSYFSQNIHIQELLMPVLIEVSPKEKTLYEMQRELLVGFGIEMEWFGDNTMAVRSVPVILGEPLSGKTLVEIMSTIIGEKDPNELVEKILKGMACKNSVKAFDRLSNEEMEGLIERLFACKDPYNCPHGRPVIVSFSKMDLEKRFKRIV